jgi:putative salt-induced outer membrane protein YdiY
MLRAGCRGKDTEEIGIMDKGHTRFNRKVCPKTEAWGVWISKCLKGCISGVFVALLFLMVVRIADADNVVMKNGERLCGKVVSMSKAKLLLKTFDVGEITIRWEDVASLSTEEPLDVCLREGETLIGKINAAEGSTLILEPTSGNRPVVLQMAQIKTLEQQKEPAGWDFDVDLSGGFSKETGNTTIEKCDMISDLTISKLSNVINLYGEFHKERINEKLSKNNATGSGSYDLFLDKKWFLFGNATAKTDKLKGMDLSGNVAAGPGYQVWRSKEKNLSVRFGPAYGYEKYANPMDFLNNEKERDSLAGYWAPEFDMWFFGRSFQLFHDDNVVYDFQDSDNWVVRTHTGIRVPMLRHFVGSFQFNYAYDNQAAAGKKYDDRSWKFGLLWAF